MSKRLRVGWCYIRIRAGVELMELPIRNRTKFDHHIRYTERLHQLSRGLGIVVARIFSGLQMTREQELDGSGAETITQDR